MGRRLFVTQLYEVDIGGGDLLDDLAHSIRSLAQDDVAGQRWSEEHRYAGYTSYASLNDLPRRDPVIGDLVKLLTKHAGKFAQECAFDLASKPKLDSLWVNVLKPGGTHSGHIHPHSAVSGTIYVATPPGAGALKLEDPRLPMMMAAPTRRADAGEDHATFVYAEPRPGSVFLWESWLRHEVVPNAAKGERISISFNYR